MKDIGDLFLRLFESDPGPTVDQLIDLLFKHRSYAVLILPAIFDRNPSRIQCSRILQIDDLEEVVEQIAEHSKLSPIKILRIVDNLNLGNRNYVTAILLDRCEQQKRIEIEFLLYILNNQDCHIGGRVWSFYLTLPLKLAEMFEIAQNGKAPYCLNAAKIILKNQPPAQMLEKLEVLCPSLIPDIFDVLRANCLDDFATLVRFAGTHKHPHAVTSLVILAEDRLLSRANMLKIKNNAPAVYAVIEVNMLHKVQLTHEILSQLET